jgi:hypothetical protein
MAVPNWKSTWNGGSWRRLERTQLPVFFCMYRWNSSTSFSETDEENYWVINFHSLQEAHSRSQWPRGLRHDPSSPSRTLGPWVRILFKAWICVCVYSVFVLSCVGIACSHLLTLIPRSRIFLPWRWRRDFPAKRRFIQDLHDAIS